MNDETVLPSEEVVLEDQISEPVTQENETASDPLDDQPVTEEVVIENEVTEESDAEEPVAMTTEPDYTPVIESVGSDIIHMNLFGSFLICGTLVGIALWRKIHGT